MHQKQGCQKYTLLHVEIHRLNLLMFGQLVGYLGRYLQTVKIQYYLALLMMYMKFHRFGYLVLIIKLDKRNNSSLIGLKIANNDEMIKISRIEFRHFKKYK